MDDDLDQIKILQHNVLHWRERKFGLTHYYKTIDPEIILINSHGMKNNEPLKIHGYTIHKRNQSDSPTDGTAMAIKSNLKFRIIDDFTSDILAAEITTSTGKIIVATLYQPPARDYLPVPDFISLFRRHLPVYMITDLNANHPFLGYRSTNVKGRQLFHLTNNGTLKHIGPQFPTFISHNAATTPDIILTNSRTYHNTHITQGALTASDHLPIILTISAKPILTPPHLD